MKYAILGDIHSNLESLRAVLDHAKSQHCAHFISLGDVVGYGPNPKECLDIVRSLNCPVVMGNHDEYCGSVLDLAGFNPMASDAIKWTRDHLTEDDREWLRNLKYSQIVESFSVVHATLDLPEKWAYVFDKLAAAASMNYQRTPVCFNGHTHVPVAFIRTPLGVQGGLYTKIKIEVGKKYFINAGSIGQPRDRNSAAAYVTYDLPSQTVELHRVEYDFRQTQKKILDAGLPETLAERLEYGK
ncbi:MAG: metallophosphoesterase family protein [Verrucomicrobia bacterium]|nr:metallophosphoesterase family protein [Verrucomicrobiota bacterium]